MYNWAVVSQGASTSNDIMYTAVILMHVLEVVLMPAEICLRMVLLQNGFQGWKQIQIVAGPVVASDWVVANH